MDTVIPKIVIDLLAGLTIEQVKTFFKLTKRQADYILSCIDAEEPSEDQEMTMTEEEQEVSNLIKERLMDMQTENQQEQIDEDEFKKIASFDAAISFEREKAFSELVNRQDKNTDWKPWYNYVFPDADVKEIIASHGGWTNNPYLLELSKYVSQKSFYFIVYLNSNGKLICRDQGQTKDCCEYFDFYQDNETYSQIKAAEAIPVQFLSEKDQYEYKLKLGQAHGMRYMGCYNIVPRMVNNAIRYVETRNAEVVRRITMHFATVLLLVVIGLFLLIKGLKWLGLFSSWLPAISLGTFFAFVMGVVGAYVSQWIRLRSYAPIVYGDKKNIWIDTLCRMLVGGISALIAVLAVRCGLLFPSLVDIPEALGFVGFIFGFSERLIPSLLKKFIAESGVEEYRDDYERERYVVKKGDKNDDEYVSDKSQIQK